MTSDEEASFKVKRFLRGLQIDLTIGVLTGLSAEGAEVGALESSEGGLLNDLRGMFRKLLKSEAEVDLPEGRVRTGRGMFGELPEAGRTGDDVGNALGGGGKGAGGTAALDANALIRGLEGGELAAIESALAGRTPTISITAAKEFLRKGDAGVLREFLAARGGHLGQAATAEQIQALQEQAQVIGRVLRAKDAAVVGSAVREGAPLITRDQRLLRFLQEVGIPAEGFWWVHSTSFRSKRAVFPVEKRLIFVCSSSTATPGNWSTKWVTRCGGEAMTLERPARDG